MRKIPHSTAEPQSAKTKPPRCKKVLVILNNRLEALELLREETYTPPSSDFPDDGPFEFAVLRRKNLLIHVPIDCVVFLTGRTQDLETANRLLKAALRAVQSYRDNFVAKRRPKSRQTGPKPLS